MKAFNKIQRHSMILLIFSVLSDLSGYKHAAQVFLLMSLFLYLAMMAIDHFKGGDHE